jgi:hypothetical protein
MERDLIIILFISCGLNKADCESKFRFTFRGISLEKGRMKTKALSYNKM